MGIYKHIGELWKHPKENLGELFRTRLVEWRTSPTIIRVERPTRIDRARSLGYKAKKGFIIVRARLTRGGRQRARIRAGRRPKHFRHKKIVVKSYQLVAEERAARKYKNCEVLGSYQVAKDGLFYWFEIILVDKNRPEIKADKNISWIAEPQHTGRVFRGL